MLYLMDLTTVFFGRLAGRASSLGNSYSSAAGATSCATRNSINVMRGILAG
jgi:hypothetical protein